MYLGTYLREVTGRPLEIWAGECHVHAAIRPEAVAAKRAAHPGADFLIHPECGCVTSTMHYLSRGLISNEHTFLLSTEGMLRHSQQSPSNEFVVATETGVLHRMRKANPEKAFYPISEGTVCRYMKTITLPKVLRSLQTMEHHITVPQEIAERARGAIDRMIAIF
jgi:quinolinate synthase